MWSVNKRVSDDDGDGRDSANICLLSARPYSEFFKCSNLFSTYYSHTRWVTIITSILIMRKPRDTFPQLIEPN